MEYTFFRWYTLLIVKTLANVSNFAKPTSPTWDLIYFLFFFLRGFNLFSSNITVTSINLRGMLLCAELPCAGPLAAMEWRGGSQLLVSWDSQTKENRVPVYGRAQGTSLASRSFRIGRNFFFFFLSNVVSGARDRYIAQRKKFELSNPSRVFSCKFLRS